jgi:putative ABC transport system permease protein
MHRVRFGLITAEIAGSLALLAGCGLMIRSAMQINSTRLGIDTSQLLRTRVVLRGASYADAAAYQRFYLDAAARLARRTGSTPVFGGPYPYWEPPPLRVETAAGVTGISASVMDVGPRFFATLGVPLRMGRQFAETDLLESEPVAIVSESAARALWPDANPVGQRVRALPPGQPGVAPPAWRRVIGVAADIRQSYDDQTTRDIYLPLLQGSASRFGSFYLRSSQSIAELTPKVRAAIAELDPLAIVHDPVLVSSEDRRLSKARFMSSLLAGFAAVAAALTMFGIYGVVAYAVQQRERETAIRIAVGASRTTIIRMFLESGVKLVAAGFAVGLLATIAVGRLLSNQLFGVSPFDPATVIGVSVLLGAAALFATFLPARRAASKSPVLVLNGE